MINKEIKVIHTKGHSKGGVCYLINDVLFSGDTLFSVAVGRTDLSSGNTKQLIESLKRIQKLDYSTLYSGHGRVSNKEEQNTNIPKWIEALKNNLIME